MNYAVFGGPNMKNAYRMIPLTDYQESYTTFKLWDLYRFRRTPFWVKNDAVSFRNTWVLPEINGYIHKVPACGFTKPDHDQNLEQFYKSAEKYGVTSDTDKSDSCWQNTISGLSYGVRTQPRWRSIKTIKMCLTKDEIPNSRHGNVLALLIVNNTVLR